jgi:hypothetical protein
VPVAHASHARSLLAVPGRVTRWPAAQVLQVAHVVAFTVTLKVPDVQAAHRRSSVLLPGEA